MLRRKHDRLLLTFTSWEGSWGACFEVALLLRKLHDVWGEGL